MAITGIQGEDVDLNVTRVFKAKTQPQSETNNRSGREDDTTPVTGDAINHLQSKLENCGQAIIQVQQAGSKSINRIDETLSSISRALKDVQGEVSCHQEELACLKLEAMQTRQYSQDRLALDQMRKQIANVQRLAEDRTSLSQLSELVSSAKKHAEEVRVYANTAIAELRVEMVQNFEHGLGELRAAVGQYKKETLQSQQDGLSVLRNEIIRHKKHTEQVQKKELMKVRNSVIEQAAVADRTRSEELSAFKGEISQISQKNRQDDEQRFMERIDEIGALDRDSGVSFPKQLEDLRTSFAEYREWADQERYLHRAEISHLKEQLEKARKDAGMWPKQLDILKTRVTRLGDGVAQVENLKMDLRLLKLQLGHTTPDDQSSEHGEREASGSRSLHAWSRDSAMDAGLPRSRTRRSTGETGPWGPLTARANDEQSHLVGEEVVSRPPRKRKSMADGTMMLGYPVGSGTRASWEPTSNNVFPPQKVQLLSKSTRRSSGVVVPELGPTGGSYERINPSHPQNTPSDRIPTSPGGKSYSNSPESEDYGVSEKKVLRRGRSKTVNSAISRQSRTAR